MSGLKRTPITRRAALKTAAGAGALVATAVFAASPALATPEPPATIERAEALLLDFEAVLLRLDDEDRADLIAELLRLEDIAGSADPHGAAAERLRETGENRPSLVWARADALAHREILPRYEPMILAGADAWNASQGRTSAERVAVLMSHVTPLVTFRKEIEAQYGDLGATAWRIAADEVEYGHCVLDPDA